MTDDFIILDRAMKHYTGFTLDVTMRVPKDSITALVGVNGSGKTTTFRIILGLLHLAVEFLGHDVRRDLRDERAFALHGDDEPL